LGRERLREKENLNGKEDKKEKEDRRRKNQQRGEGGKSLNASKPCSMRRVKKNYQRAIRGAEKAGREEKPTKKKEV